ncbi:MAG: twin-arginine translocation signal domain-containing protein [Chloroflexia bacterium]|nr:twin-arginine translocation signal domain-containing protein [Chloroflexia bacterium]
MACRPICPLTGRRPMMNVRVSRRRFFQATAAAGAGAGYPLAGRIPDPGN